MENKIIRVWKNGQKGYFFALSFYASITFAVILCIAAIFPFLDEKFELIACFLLTALFLGSFALLIFLLSRESFTVEYDQKQDLLIVIRGKEKSVTNQFSNTDTLIFEKIVVAVKSIASPDGLSKPVSSHYRIIFNQSPFNELCHFVLKKEMMRASKLIYSHNKNLKMELKVEKKFLSRDQVKNYW